MHEVRWDTFIRRYAVVVVESDGTLMGWPGLDRKIRDFKPGAGFPIYKSRQDALDRYHNCHSVFWDLSKAGRTLQIWDELAISEAIGAIQVLQESQWTVAVVDQDNEDSSC